jgi:thioredoxin
MADITDETFEKEVIKQSEKMSVVVDFWAPWCGPCLMLKPVMDKLAEEYKGKVAIVKLNVQDNPEVAGKYDIMSIPAVKMFQKGKEVDGFVGLQSENSIRTWIDANK